MTEAQPRIAKLAPGDLDEDQRALQDTLRGFLADQLSSAALRNSLDTDTGYDPQLHARLAGELDSQPLLLVPHLDEDVHDIVGLLRVHEYLFAPDSERERLLADVVA